MNTTGLRNLSSIFDRLKAADPKANSQPNAALDRLDAAVALMAPAPEPPSGYTIDDMEEADGAGRQFGHRCLPSIRMRGLSRA